MSLFEKITTPNGQEYEQPLGLFINGEVVPSSSGKTIASIDPATESVIAEVHAASAKDVDIAVQAAKAALIHPSWKLLPGTERGILMNKLADLIEANKEVLAAVDSWDNGKLLCSHLKSLGQSDRRPPQVNPTP